MEKALQDCFYVQQTDKNGNTLRKQPIRYDRSCASYVLDGANNHLLEIEGRDLTQQTHDEFICWCLNEYHVNGASPRLMNTLNMNICVVGHQCQILPSNNKLLSIFVAHIPFNPPPAILASYMFSNMVSLGWIDGLKRCHSPECQKFFIGRSNVKWCSKTCGSRTRVKRMRKKKRTL